MRYLIVAALASGSLAGCNTTQVPPEVLGAAQSLPAVCAVAMPLIERLDVVEPFIPVRYAIPAAAARTLIEFKCDNAEQIANAAAAVLQVQAAQRQIEAALAAARGNQS